ncbi:MAG: outer membrane beta-barrel protein [Woeseiaceae bacterium]|nr:outer membrane beta-barrel protein [Woeseiaceae bacterium]
MHGSLTLRARKLCLTALILIASPCAFADANVYLGLGLGVGDIDLSGDVSGSGEFDTAALGGENALVAEFKFGVQLSSGWLAEISFDDYESVSLLLVDSVDYDAVRFGAGYSSPSANPFGFSARIGLAFWDLELRESPLFNPGSEARFETDGEDLYLQIGGEFHAADNWRIGLDFDYSDTDFGTVRALKINTRFLFGR